MSSVVMILGLLLIFVVAGPPEYVATVSFVPQSKEGVGRSPLASLAAQYGVTLSTGDEARGPQFYASLVHSRRLLKTVADASYTVSTANGSAQMSLAEFFEPGRPQPAAREALLRRLRSMIRPRVARETSVVQITATAPQPELARQIAQNVLDAINRYNVSSRQSSAAAERRFVEERLAKLRFELSSAERALESFLRTNRQFENSPELRLVHDRLQREVTMRQQIVTSLAQAFEQAKIEEVRNTPVISVIEEPEAPVLPASRGRVRKIVILTFFSVAVGIAAAIGAAVLENNRRYPSAAYREFTSALAELKR